MLCRSGGLHVLGDSGCCSTAAAATAAAGGGGDDGNCGRSCECRVTSASDAALFCGVASGQLPTSVSSAGSCEVTETSSSGGWYELPAESIMFSSSSRSGSVNTTLSPIGSSLYSSHSSSNGSGMDRGVA